MEKDVYLNSVSFPLWHKAIDKIICGVEGQMLLRQRRLGRGVQNNYKNKVVCFFTELVDYSYDSTRQMYGFYTYSPY